jgi:DNA-binding NtrC family response regulator
MFEDALFGHVRGAFTGAATDAPGYLAEADSGTAFFDEIGGLQLAMQAKLLRAVETKCFRPVGARADRRSNFRLVAATNQDISALVARGEFRADLAHRLCGSVIRVPSLSSRREDIPLLVRHFASESNTDAAFSDDAIHELRRRPWPGNVRQLRQVVQLLCGVCTGRTVDLADLLDIAPPAAVSPICHSGVATTELEFARLRLVELLKRSRWSVPDVAQELGVNKSTIYRRIEKLGIVCQR